MNIEDGRTLVRFVATSGFAVGGALIGVAISAAAARGLGPDQFALFASVAGLTAIPVTVSGGLLTSTAGLQIRGASLPEYRQSMQWLRGSLSFAVVSAVAFGGLVAAVTWSSGVAISLAFSGVAVSLSIFVASLYVSKLVARGNVTEWHALGLLTASIRLFLSLFAIARGWGVASLFWIFAISQMLLTVLSAKLSKAWTLAPSRFFSSDFPRHASFFALIAVGLQLDVVAAPATLGASAAGEYSAMAVLAKGGTLLALLVGVSAFPSAVKRHEFGVNRSKPNWRVLLASVGAAVVSLGFIALFGQWIVAIVFGNQYKNAQEILPLVCLAAIPWAVAQTLVWLHMPNTRWMLAGLLLVICLFEWILLMLVDSVNAFIASWGLSGLAYALSYIGYFWLRRATSGEQG